MKRTFTTVNYEQALDLTVRLGDCLPPEHLARFVVDSVALLDVSALYAHYGSRGAEPYAPEVLLGLLFYGYATGVFSSRKIERATYEAVPFRFIAGNQHPDHDTLATFRRTFLPELKDLCVQVLLLAQEAGVLKLGTISLDGTKMHAAASRHNAVSYKRLLELETQVRAEIEELFLLSEQSDQRELPDGLVVREEMARREDRLVRLAEAKAVLQARATARLAAEQAEYEARLAQRAERERTTGRRPGGRPPTPPVPGPRDGDQYTLTDPESRIRKNPPDAGFEQDYNVQIAVDQKSLLIVSSVLSNHPNDTQEAEPTLAAIPSEIGTPEAAALDAGYFGPATLAACAKRRIEPYIATGRDPHHPSWQQRFAPLSDPPPEEASPQVKMAYKLKTALGKAIYGARTCTARTGDRRHQGSARLPPVLLAWGTGGGWRVVSGLFGLQSEALPYLILGLTRERRPVSSHSAHHHRRCSACDRVPFSRSYSCHERHARWQSNWRDPCFVLSDKLLATVMLEGYARLQGYLDYRRKRAYHIWEMVDSTKDLEAGKHKVRRICNAQSVIVFRYILEGAEGYDVNPERQDREATEAARKLIPRLRTMIRKEDKLSINGPGIMTVVIRTEQHGAELVAKRIQEAVQAAPVRIGIRGREVKITVAYSSLTFAFKAKDGGVVPRPRVWPAG